MLEGNQRTPSDELGSRIAHYLSQYQSRILDLIGPPPLPVRALLSIVAILEAPEKQDSRLAAGLLESLTSIGHDAKARELAQLLRELLLADRIGQSDEQNRPGAFVETRVEPGDGVAVVEKEPPPFAVLDSRPPGYVDRPQLRAWLEERVAAGGCCLLHGAPGSGKSTIALELGWRLHKAGRAVVQQFCGPERDFTAAGVDLASKIPGDDPQQAPELRIENARRWLHERGALLILDDVWDESVMQLAPGPNSFVLYTSRRPVLPGVLETREAGGFRPEESRKLIEQRLAKWLPEHEEALEAFARQVEHLPYALEVAVRLLEGKAFPSAEAIERLDRLARKSGNKDLDALLREAYDVQPEDAQRLLAAAALAAPEGVWLPFIQEVAELEGDAAEDAFDSLTSGALIRVADQTQQTVSVHAELRRVLVEDAEALQDRRVEVLIRRLGVWEADRKQWQEPVKVLAEAEAAAEWLAETDDDQRFRNLVGPAWDMAESVGRLESAYRLVSRATAFFEATGDQTGLQAFYGNQALILQAWGRLDDAMALHQKEQAICEASGDLDGLYRSYGNQALILQDWGRLDEAMDLHKKEQSICAALGDQDGLVACYGNQAFIFQTWGRLDDAMELLQKQKAICEALGDQDGLAACFGNQALILKAWGRLDDAMELHKKEQDICEALGDQAGLQASYGNQALILQDWGRLDDAMELLKKQQAICEDLGDQDGLSRSYGNQALILQDWGRLDDAMNLHKKQQAICEDLGDQDGLARSYGNQALILKAWGRLDDAMELHKKEQAVCEALGDQAGLQASHGNQALILQDWGRLDDAMELHKKKQAICEALGDQAGLARSLANQGSVLGDMGQPQERCNRWREAEAIFARIGMPRELEQVRSLLKKHCT